MTRVVCVVLCALLGAGTETRARQEQQTPSGTITGLVVDVSGAPVPGAVVSMDSPRTAGQPVPPAGRSGTDGRFEIASAPAGRQVIRVSLDGYADVTDIVMVEAAAAIDVRIVLRPAAFTESVSVTASRGVRGLEGPASVTVVTSGQLTSSAAGGVDDALRATPGFSLFRRSSSRVANPTTQGVTLRGLSASGASRSLVLADGGRLNDPFGSWVYWNRVPMAAIERIEVVRGASGDLYGADALGGVIQILTFDPGRARVRTFLDAASHDTVRGSIYAGGTVGRVVLAGGAEGLRMDGVPVVAADERGPIDVPASSEYRTGFGRIGYAAAGWDAHLQFGTETERRGNGTPAQRNATTWREAAGSARGPVGGGLLSIRGTTGSQTYDQSFSAISAARDSERLTSQQRIPATFSSVSGQWARPFGRQTMLLGAEGRWTKADISEIRYALTGAASGPFVTEGAESAGGVFARVNLVPSATVSIDAGLRVDVWRPEQDASVAARRDETFVSPRVSVSWQATSAVAAHASVYQGSRTPTLNELYRGFRVGNVVTNPNPSLDPERLNGAEGGVLVTRGPASYRVTGFLTQLTDAVTNVTLTTTPAQIVRQRQNTDTVRGSGVEVEAMLRPWRDWSFTGLAVFTASHFVKTPAQPSLEGNRIPQVPRWQLGASVTWANPRFATAVLEARFVGSQFEDDQNTLELRKFAVVDLAASRSLTRVLHVFAGLENLFNADYDTGLTPVRNIGWPRTGRVGLRVFLP